MRDIWNGLLKARITVLRGEQRLLLMSACTHSYITAAKDQKQIDNFLVDIRTVLVDLLKTKLDLNMEPVQPNDPPFDPALKKKSKWGTPHKSRWNLGLKLVIMRDLWSILVVDLPRKWLRSLAQDLLPCVASLEEDLTGGIEIIDEVKQEWMSLCAEIALECGDDSLMKLWTGKFETCDVPRNWSQTLKRYLWSWCIDRWRDNKSTSLCYDYGLDLLCFPFLWVYSLLRLVRC